MRWRTVEHSTWEEIREKLPDVLKDIAWDKEHGFPSTYWFDLEQKFDDDKNFGLVVGWDAEGELAMKLAYETYDSYCHDYDMDWLYPVTDEEGGICWDTEIRVSKEDADRPEFMKETIDWLQDQWLAMVAYFTRKNYLMEEANMYKPEPIDTTNVVLPEEITELTEKLAESTHDTWAKNRIEQGWTYGEKRDDDKKLHPCLIPYDELPDSEKKYDRDTAMETLKAIYALGYKIVKEE